MKKRGFSLAELLVGLTLIATVAASVGVLSLNSRHRAGSQGLALEVCSQLRAARQKAVATQTPVTVAFPSRAGSVGHSQGLTLAQGTTVARPFKIVNFSGDFPNSSIFLGYWPVSGGLTNALQPMAHQKSSRLPVDKWLPVGLQDDYCIIFTPDGGVTSNGLVTFGQAIHLVVASGIGSSPGTAPAGTPALAAPAYHVLQQCGEAYTISVSLSGGVEMQSGVSGLSALGGSPTDSFDPARPDPIPAPSNNAPSITNVTVTPKIDPALLPAGVDSLVCAGDHVSLVVNATDADGDTLYCRWTCAAGNFSQAGEERMTWNWEANCWTSNWQWRCPTTAMPSNAFTLTLEVHDTQGALGSVVVGTPSVKAKVIRRGVLAAAHFSDVTLIRPNGAVVRKVPSGSTVLQACMTPDSKHVGWTACCGTGGFLSNLDGTGIAWMGTDIYCPAISPTGSQVAFWDWSQKLCVADANGSNRVVIGSQASPFSYPQWSRNLTPAWSPDGKKLAVRMLGGPTPGLRVMNRDGSANTLLASDGVSPTWTNAGIYYLAERTGQREIYRIQPDGSGDTQISNLGPFANSGIPLAMCLFDVDGDRTSLTASPYNEGLAYVESGKVYIYDETTGTTEQVNQTSGCSYVVWGK